VEEDPHGEAVSCGESYSVMEVFTAYFASMRHKGGEAAPHLVFAHCAEGLDSILQFTKQWGPLMPTSSDSAVLRKWIKTDEVSGEQHFAFYASEWRVQHQRFKKALASAASSDSSQLRELVTLWPHWTLSTFKTGGIYLGVERARPLDDFMRWWSCTPDQARRWATSLGMLISGGKQTRRFQIKLMAATLWDALWLMLAYDLSMQRLSVGICENPKCGREYVADRSNKRYCSAACAQRSASLSYYHRKGKKRRTANRARKSA
jgi:hypothetical protein